MRKFLSKLPLILLCLLICTEVISQCSVPCPQVFTIRDSINCNVADVRPNNPGPGYSNNPFLIRTCKNSLMTYQFNIPNPCYAGTIYTFISILGGTYMGGAGSSFSVLWGASSTGQVKFQFDTPGSAGLAPCRDTITLNFSLITSPVAAFTATPQPVCNLNPTTINFNSSTTTNATGFFWNFGDAYTSVLANPSHAYASPGTYTVTLIASNQASLNGQPVCPTCMDTVQHTITIDNLPGPAIECVATVCAGDTARYCTNDLSCSGYLWAVTGGTIISGQNTPCVTVKWGSGNPQGTINLAPSGCATVYCPSGTTVTVPIIPTSGVVTGPPLVCINTSGLYSLPSWPGTTYSWTGGGTITPFNTNTNQVNVNWPTAGSFTLTCNYFDSSLNCGGVATYPVLVRPNLSINGPATVCANQTTNLTATRPPSIPVNSNWTISPVGATINSGNGTSSINVTWPLAGTYIVTASPTLPNITCDDASYTVNVLPAPVISSINGTDSICPGNTYVYSATSNTTGIFIWNPTNAASFTLLGVNNDSIQVTWAASGPYSLSVFQSSIPYGCISNTFIKNIFPYPTPLLTGPTNVCADATVNYSITNIASGNFVWTVSPANFGTIISGQGTNTVTIKWHGNNNPGFPNTVYLKYGVCGTDSVAITINEPVIPVITQTGSLCGPGGITLSTGVTGVFTWTGPGVPPPGNTSSITGITIPGVYNVQIQNINGSGCTVNATITVPDTGRPVASISATNVLTYCLPNVPNMNLVAVNGPGYTFQWYQSPSTLLLGETNQTLAINTLTLAGSYSYYCVVTLGGCVVTSNVLTIIISNCPPNPGCSAAIDVTSISGCNPFTLTIAATAPSGAVLNGGTGNPSITHLEDNYMVNGLTTRTYTSIGFKQIKVCADVQLPDLSICRVCKDTVVNVTVAADFTSVVNCDKINLFDASTVVFPATISLYSWSVGTNPGNTPVPPVVASFNNPSIPNPVLTFLQSGSYIVSLTIKSGGCNITVMDTFNISVPDANFTFNNSCVGTPVNFNNVTPAPTNFWNFGDASTSYVSPTSHAYASAGSFPVTHIVTDLNGCKDTVVKIVNIVSAPVCTVTNAGPLTFCFKDSVILGSSCPGLINFQWYNNGVAIVGATASTDTVKQTGNYHFIAYDVNGCRIVSDTVAVNVLQAPNVNITTQGKLCQFSAYTTTVPSCVGCTYQWLVDGSPVSTSNSYTGFGGSAPYTVGPHTIVVQVTNGSGCSDSDTINVVFNPQPTISINIAGPLPVCSNNLYTFTAISNASSPSWNWTFNNANFTLSTSNSLTASANGNYLVVVTDGVTGCTNQAFQQIQQSPLLNLFPAGCDTLCDSSHLYLPIASLNGNISGYIIKWYDNAPPYSPVIGSGPSFPLNTLLPGNHNISVIVTSPNGCQDTSDVYSIFTRSCVSPVLAVKRLTINVRQSGSMALVGWTAEQEINNDHYEVEKSLDGIHFGWLKSVPGRGNSNIPVSYSIFDSLPQPGSTAYYRIKAVDINGSIAYSSIGSLRINLSDRQTLTVIPNPSMGSTQISFQSNQEAKGELEIHTTEGKLVFKKTIQLSKGVNSYSLSLDHLPPAFYIVTVQTATATLTGRLIRQ